MKLATIAELSIKSKPLNQVSNPIVRSRFESLEKSLTELFDKELNSKDSIFIRIQPGVVRRIALFVSGMMARPAAIGVCGETASGKSTIVLDSMDAIECFCQEFMLKNIVTRLNTDDYYYDRSEEVKKAGSFAAFAKNYDLDVPAAIELSLMKEHISELLQNREVYLPKYDMSGTAIRTDNCVLAKPSSIVVAEGLYTLINEVADIFDFKIYVDIDKEVQKRRFFERAAQRGLGDSADMIFANASKKAQVYVHPCSNNADIVLNGEASREKFKRFVSLVLNLVETNYYSFAV